MEQSLSYQKALLQNEQNRYRVKQLEQVYIPYITIGSGKFRIGSDTSSGSRTTADGTAEGGGSGESSASAAPVLSSSLDFSLQAGFENVFGTDITISAPFSWEIEDGFTPDLPTLTVSRQLFDESGVDLLKARANYAKSRRQVLDIKSELLIGLVKDIFDYHYYLQAEAIQREYERNYERMVNFVHEEESMRSLRKQWYSVRKGLLETEKEMLGFKVNASELKENNITRLYDELVRSANNWEQALPVPDTPLPPREDVEAFRLSLQAAEREEALWFLPYLPNPTVSAGISYDLNEQAVDWSIGITFTVEIIDRGERASASLARKRGAALARLELEEALRTRMHGAETLWKDKEILKLTHSIAELTTEEKEAAFLDAEQLFEGGFISEEELRISKLDYRNALLAEERAYCSYLVHLLRLFHAYGIDGTVMEFIQGE